MMENESLRSKIKEFLKMKFDLSEDKAHEDEVVSNVTKSVVFQGTNLWVLIFATFVASIGLNVNSTAVIIGAMLISPLMGPIMGFGLAVGINDFELLKRSLRNFGFAVLISLVVSWIYFLLSPLNVAQSELLARTQPTTWDVLIAFFGGLAGIVAQSRKDRTSTVIPGVAIATALMPPLCTAGYGLATLQFDYFFGAFYLFFINTVFISLATYMIVRFMKYEKKVAANANREHKIRRIMATIVFVTVVPSILLAINIVNKTVFDANASKYVEQAFAFKDSQVVDFRSKYSQKTKSIEVMVIGAPISKDAIESLKNQLSNYNLDETELIVKQQSTGDATMNGVDSRSLDKLYSISNNLIEEKDKQIVELKNKVRELSYDRLPASEIAKEFGAISSLDGVAISLSKNPLYGTNGITNDSIIVCYVRTKEHLTISESQQEQIVNWLKVRTSSKNVKLILE